MFVRAMGLLVVSMLLAGCGGPARVVVKEGRFVNSRTGDEFHPHGFNYIRLGTNGRGWHDTFNPQTYDAVKAENALTDMARNGFNIVRVFIDHTAGSGSVESREATELSPKYMANFIDFAERARAHGQLLILAFCDLPDSRRYREIIGQAPDNVRTQNVYYLSEGHIAAKAQYMADFAQVIRKHDPKLLASIFSYEHDNESNFSARTPPFSLKTGAFEFRGRSYDLSKDDELQALADEGLKAALNACVAAVRKVDPKAQVAADVFTFAAVGRTGPAHLRQDETRDARFPARPAAIAESDAAYVDIHFYSLSEAGLERDLASIEWDKLAPLCREKGKPLIMGEYGAFKGRGATTVERAAEISKAHLLRVLKLGFTGDLYWTYDTDEQPNIWNGKMGAGEVLKALAEVKPGETAP